MIYFYNKSKMADKNIFQAKGFELNHLLSENETEPYYEDERTYQIKSDVMLSLLKKFNFNEIETAEYKTLGGEILEISGNLFSNTLFNILSALVTIVLIILYSIYKN